MLNYYTRYAKVTVKRSLHNTHFHRPDAIQMAEIFIVIWTIACIAKIASIGH